MKHTLVELDVRLRHIKPPIWRTVELPGSTTLAGVHHALQVALGWTNSHLHAFAIGRARYGMADVDSFGERGDLDERQYRLQDVVRAGDKFLYEYDFGDGWEHDVKVTKVTPVAKAPAPRCTAGARACPPEDCGGPGGYADLLDILAAPRHEEHEDRLAWLGEPYAPEQFSMPAGGRDLRRDIAALIAAGEEDPPDVDHSFVDLPRPLVEAVLAMPPHQRAALAAMIAGSLANELEDAMLLLDQHLAATRAPKTPRTPGRTRKPKP